MTRPQITVVRGEVEGKTQRWKVFDGEQQVTGAVSPLSATEHDVLAFVRSCMDLETAYEKAHQRLRLTAERAEGREEDRHHAAMEKLRAKRKAAETALRTARDAAEEAAYNRCFPRPVTPLSAACEKCPWVGRFPGITVPKAVRDSVAAGGWVPCHVHMGTCAGAQEFAAREQKKAQPPAPESP